MSDLIEQGSAEWHQQRLGKVTASRIADMLARTRSGWSTSRANYASELVVERLTGQPTEGFKSAAMQWGTEREPDARAAYEFRTDVTVEPVGFIDHPALPMCGASPDGLVGSDGLVEIKCPITATHIDTLLAGTVPDRYVMQMQWQMAVTDRQWCDFVSFDPRMPEAMSLFVRRIERDAARIAEIENEVVLFLNEVEATVRALRKRYEMQEAA